MAKGFKKVGVVVNETMQQLKVKSIRDTLSGLIFKGTHEFESGIESDEQATVTQVDFDGKGVTIGAQYCVGDTKDIDMYTTMTLEEAEAFARSQKKDGSELDWLT